MAFLLAPLKLVATEREVREGSSEHRPLCRAIEQDCHRTRCMASDTRSVFTKRAASAPAAHKRRHPQLNEAANLSPRLLAATPDEVTRVVLVDGRSTEGTVEVARRLYARVPRCLRDEPQRGQRVELRVRRVR
jgi:hypothetical protein